MHKDGHSLPIGKAPREPKEVFEPKRYGNRKVVIANQKLLARDTRLWPVLAGLHAVDLPVMGHVSAFCYCKDERALHYCHPLWIQITTLPTESYRRRIPLVIKDGVLIVQHLWAGNDEHGDPYQFLNREDLLPGSAGHSSLYWTEFFLSKISWLYKKPPDHDVNATSDPTQHAVMAPA